MSLIANSFIKKTLIAKAIELGGVILTVTYEDELGNEIAFSPLDLFSGGEQGVGFDFFDVPTLSQDAAGTTPVTADAQPVGRVLDKSGNGNHGTQGTQYARPIYNTLPDCITIDKVIDAIIVTVPVGGWVGSMVIGTGDGTASYGVDLPAGSHKIGGQFFSSNKIFGVLIREGAVADADLAKVEAYFVENGAKASYGDATSLTKAWKDKNITIFPAIDTKNVTNFASSFAGNKYTEFPSIDTSEGIYFNSAWTNTNLSTFPLLDFRKATTFSTCWYLNVNLTDFPAHSFDNCLCTNFMYAFHFTNLSQTSIDGILVSINSNLTSSGLFWQSGGSAPSATGRAAITAMRSRDWAIGVTGGF